MSIADDSSQTSDVAPLQQSKEESSSTFHLDGGAANHNKGCIYGILRSFNELNASWRYKWWYSTVHNTTAIIGAGVLSLPASMVFLTWVPGILILSLLWLISLITLWQMIQMHEDEQGNRFDRYHELGQHLLGRRLGLWIVVPLQLLTAIGVDTVYVLTAAKSMSRMNEVLHDGKSLDHIYWILVFGCIQLILSQFQQFTSITWISILATFTAIGYSTTAWSTTLNEGLHGNRFDNVSYNFPNVSTEHAVFGIFAAMGQMAFATAGHNVVLEIQATMPSTIEVPSKIAMWHGSLVAYGVTALCYFPCASIGYWFYGNQQNDNNTLHWVFDPREDRPKHVHDNLALVLKHSPGGVVFIVNMLVVLHMYGSYQIYAMPLFDNVDIFLNHKYGIRPNFTSRILVRSLYVGLTCLLAWGIHFFGDLLAFFGGFAIVPTTFVLPGILWHFHRKPTPFSPTWLANMVAIVIGTIITITSSVAGMRYIVKDIASTLASKHSG